MAKKKYKEFDITSCAHFFDDLKEYQECYGLSIVFLMTKRPDFARLIFQKIFVSNVKFIDGTLDAANMSADTNWREYHQTLCNNYNETFKFLKKLVDRFEQYEGTAGGEESGNQFDPEFCHQQFSDVSVKYTLPKMSSAVTIILGDHEHALEGKPMRYHTPTGTASGASPDPTQEKAVMTYMGALAPRSRQKEDLGITFMEKWSMMALHQHGQMVGLRKANLYGFDSFLLYYYKANSKKIRVLHRGSFVEHHKYPDSIDKIDIVYNGGMKDGMRAGFGSLEWYDKETKEYQYKEGQWEYDKLIGVAKVNYYTDEKVVDMWGNDTVARYKLTGIHMFSDDKPTDKTSFENKTNTLYGNFSAFINIYNNKPEED